MPTEAEVMPSAEFVRRLKEEIARSPQQRVNHPFVRAVCEGRASMEQLRQWALQDYQFRRAVPRIAMLRYLACTDPVFQPKLYEVVADETQGLRPGSVGHPDMFVEFAAALALARRETTGTAVTRLGRGWGRDWRGLADASRRSFRTSRLFTSVVSAMCAFLGSVTS